MLQSPAFSTEQRLINNANFSNQQESEIQQIHQKVHITGHDTIMRGDTQMPSQLSGLRKLVSIDKPLLKNPVQISNKDRDQVLNGRVGQINLGGINSSALNSPFRQQNINKLRYPVVAANTNTPSADQFHSGPGYSL